MEIDSFREMIDAKIDTIKEEITSLRLQVGRVESHVESEQATALRAYKNINEKLNSIHKALYGNGDHGLKTKVTILEKQFDNHKWNIRAIWLAFLALIGRIVYEMYTRLIGS